MTAGGFGPIGADRLRPDNLRLVQQPHLALREGDRDAMFLERIPQRQKHLPAHIGPTAGRVAIQKRSTYSTELSPKPVIQQTGRRLEITRPTPSAALIAISLTLWGSSAYEAPNFRSSRT